MLFIFILNYDFECKIRKMKSFCNINKTVEKTRSTPNLLCSVYVTSLSHVLQSRIGQSWSTATTKIFLIYFCKLVSTPRPSPSYLSPTSGVIFQTSESPNMCETCWSESYLCLYSSVGVRVEVIAI